MGDGEVPNKAKNWDLYGKERTDYEVATPAAEGVQDLTATAQVALFRKVVSSSCASDKGKPLESAGRKTTGLNPWSVSGTVAELPGEHRSSSEFRAR